MTAGLTRPSSVKYDAPAATAPHAAPFLQTSEDTGRPSFPMDHVAVTGSRAIT
jgi:hypothetical protein